MTDQISQKHADAVAEIAAIDRLIDGTRSSAFMLAGYKSHPMSARTWHRIWGRFPSLRHHENTLYGRRYYFQVVRDTEEARAFKAAERRKAREFSDAYRAKCCPTCGRSAS